MVDWGSGYFAGLKFGFILIVLGIEFYYLIFERIIEKEIEHDELIILGILFIISIIVAVLKNSLIAIFLPFSGFIILYFLKEKKEEKITKDMEIKRLKELGKIIKQQPNNFNAYVEIGDYYFKKEDYEEALKYYKKAYEIKELPWISQKIKISKKEDKIKKGIIWICRECGEENKREDEKCKNCGMEKNLVKSILTDLKANKKYIILLFVSPLIVTIFFLIYLHLPLYLSLFLTLFLIYLAIRIFYSF